MIMCFNVKSEVYEVDSRFILTSRWLNFLKTYKVFQEAIILVEVLFFFLYYVYKIFENANILKN